MRTVLVVGMVNSIHITRFCRSIDRDKWNVYLFPCHDAEPHPDLADLVVFDPTGAMKGRATEFIELRPVFPRSRFATRPGARGFALAAAIARLRPDIVHAQELQHGGYLTVDARRVLPRFPTLITTIWGSDLSLRARQPEELTRILDVFHHTDVLTAECERDIRHARSLGYSAETVTAMPVAGGLNLAKLSGLRAPGATSQRRTIAVKGYQGWAGRAEVALQAIRRCGSSLSGYTIALYSANPDVVRLAEQVGAESSLNVSLVSRGPFVPHDEILSMHGRSRLSIGLSMADGISTSFLEAMAMGSFPIQSDTACVNEWITDGESGFIVSPEDPDTVAAAIKRAVEDDDLVDHAATVNAEVTARRLDDRYLRAQLMLLYDRIVKKQVAGSRR